MDGKGAWRDNVFVERLWRSIKYEEVYLQGSRGGLHQFRKVFEMIQWYGNLSKMVNSATALLRTRGSCW